MPGVVGGYDITPLLFPIFITVPPPPPPPIFTTLCLTAEGNTGSITRLRNVPLTVCVCVWGGGEVNKHDGDRVAGTFFFCDLRSWSEMKYEMSNTKKKR